MDFDCNTKEKTIYIGIDEAGRGPVIGPMVMAAVMIKDTHHLSFIHTDSKHMSRKKRQAYLTKIMEKTISFVEVKHAHQINHLMKTTSLNQIEIMMMTNLISKCVAQATTSHLNVLIDAPEKNTTKFSEKLKRALASHHLEKNLKISIIAENKADEHHSIVGAASIVAKVFRDHLVSKIKNHVEIDFGSGYPSDQKTKDALKRHYTTLSPYVRKKWKTVKQLNLGQQTLFD